jgi:hypothetical protein
VITYDEAGLTYDEAGLLYDGIELGANATLIVAGADVTSELADRSLKVHTGTHGNSLGTAGATLNDPASLPAVEDAIDVYAGAGADYARLFRGLVRVVDVTEYRGGHVFAAISAQDSGPDTGTPSAAPWGLSDNPNGTTTHGYESLRVTTRTTEGGAAKTTAVVSVREDGLYPALNVELTSANNGLTAEELTIVEMDVSWPQADAPLYRLTLGEALVKLAQVMAHQALEDDVITSTMISDGAISTPKLAANAVTAAKIAAGTITATEIAAGAITTEKLAAAAVIANVLNAGGNVEIDSSGIAVTGDAGITVTNGAAVVVIDGTSNMFKIVTSGTTSKTQATNTAGISTVSLGVLVAGGKAQAHLCFLSEAADNDANRYIGYIPFTNSGSEPPSVSRFVAASSGGAVTTRQTGMTESAGYGSVGNNGGTGACEVHLALSNAHATDQTVYMKYFIFKEVAV